MPHRVIEVLLVGTNRLPDGRTIAFDRQRIARICAQANAQLKAGIRFPTAWMHDPDARPVHLSNPAKDSRLHPDAWLAKGYFGEPVAYRQDPHTGHLVAKVFIPDEADARQFDKVGQVSPGLWQDWTDELGVRWPGLTIAHIAATPKPVQRHVNRTKYPATYLSQPARAAAAYLLSFPATPRSEHMADEYEDDDKDMETEGGVNLTPEQIGKIVEMCAKHGLQLAGDIQDANHLLIAMESASNTLTGDGGAGDAPEGDGMGADEEAGMEDVPAPVMMSQPVAARLGKLEHADLERQLKELLAAGKITKAMYDADVVELNAVNLSNATASHFRADGTRKPTKLDLKIDIYRQLPATSLKRGAVHLSHPVADVPNPHAGGSPEEREKAAADEVKAHMAKKKAGTKGKK